MEIQILRLILAILCTAHFGLVFGHPYDETKYQFWNTSFSTAIRNFYPGARMEFETMRSNVSQGQDVFDAMKAEMRSIQYTNFQKRMSLVRARKRQANNDLDLHRKREIRSTKTEECHLVCTSMDFKNIRDNNGCYIDKTYFVHLLFVNPLKSYFFIARPRKFGKTLFVNTLRHALLKNRTLFEGLYIDRVTNNDFWNQKYSVMHMDFSKLATGTSQDTLRSTLVDEFREIAATVFHAALPNNENYVKKDGTICMCKAFKDLLKFSQKFPEPVALLIDEYDSPIIKNIKTNDIETADAMREVVREFFECVKVEFEIIKFLFITGVTRFVQGHLFSNMNSLADLTFDKNFANAFGFTSKEINDNLMPQVANVVKERKGMNRKVTRKDRRIILDEMKLYYDGYRFTYSEGDLYSPHAVNNFLDTKQHNVFLEKTPHVELAFQLFPQFQRTEFPIGGINISIAKIEALTQLSKLDLKKILFETGIITIKRYDEFTQTIFLNFPNKKVQEFSENTVFAKFLQGNSLSPDLLLECEQIINNLLKLDSNNAEEVFNDLKTKIEKNLYFEDQPKLRKNSKTSTKDNYLQTLETFYELHVYILLRLGQIKLTECDVKRQETAEAGRHDLTITCPKQGTVILELKVSTTKEIRREIVVSATEQAISYAQHFFEKDKFVTCCSVIFNSHSKNIENWAGVKYDHEGKRIAVFSKGGLIKGKDISDKKLNVP